MGLRNLNKKFSKRGFTDQLYWCNFKFVVVFVILCYTLNALQGLLGISELAIITYGIPAAFGELGVHTAVVVTKARKENMAKYTEAQDGGTAHG